MLILLRSWTLFSMSLSQDMSLTSMKSSMVETAETHGRRLLVMHIIEQMGGASKSLVQFLLLANRTGRRAILPGIAVSDVQDRTVYRSFNRSSVKDIDYFLDPSALSALDTVGMPPMGFRQHLEVAGSSLDAVLIFVTDPRQRPLFKQLIRKKTGSMAVNCSWLWDECQREPVTCGQWFMSSKLDLRGIELWDLSPGAPVLCIHNNLSYWNESLGDWLHRNFSSVQNVAILSWLGIFPVPCKNLNRVCSSFLDANGYGTTIEQNVRRCLSLSSSVHHLADNFLASHPELTSNYNSVQMRAEMVLASRHLSPECNDKGVEKWFSELKSTMSTWNGTWFRARDVKLGGSATLARYDAQSLETLKVLEADLWKASPVSFVDNDCSSLSGVMCLLLDVALLSRGKQLFLWGGSGGVDMLTRIERRHLGKREKTTFRSIPSRLGC